MLSSKEVWYHGLEPDSHTNIPLLSPFLFLTLSFALTQAQSSCASFAPGWLITGRSNIFEFMGGLSHTVPASGYMCNPALLFFTISDRYDSNGILMAYSAKTVWLSSSICLWICLLPDNALCVHFGICFVVSCQVCWWFTYRIYARSLW